MIYIDIETTGLSITQDRIVQIGCIKGKEEKQILINPEMPIPKEASDIHGITDEMVKDAPTFKQIAKGLLEFLADDDIAGYNSNSYDVPLLMEEFARCDLELSLDRKFEDMYQNECKLNRRNLETVYKRMTGKDLEGAHGALADSLATKEIHELQMKIEGIEEILNPEDEVDYVDFTRKIYINTESINVWAFGKNKDKPIQDDRSYCNWVLRGDFSKQVKDIVRSAING